MPPPRRRRQLPGQRRPTGAVRNAMLSFPRISKPAAGARTATANGGRSKCPSARPPLAAILSPENISALFIANQFLPLFWASPCWGKTVKRRYFETSHLQAICRENMSV